MFVYRTRTFTGGSGSELDKKVNSFVDELLDRGIDIEMTSFQFAATSDRLCTQIIYFEEIEEPPTDYGDRFNL